MEVKYEDEVAYYVTLSKYKYDCEEYPEETVMDTIINMIDTHDSETVIEYIKGVHANSEEVNYTELLKYACRMNKKSIVKYLLRNYRNKISIDDGYTEYTALMYAVSNMSYDVVKLLIEYGADTQMCTNMDETAFYIATENMKNVVCKRHIKIKIVKMLVKNSECELSVLIRKGNINAIKILLDILMYA